MAKTEIFQPLSLFCDTGEVQATVMVEASADLRDNVTSFVETPCPGCKHWSVEKVRRTEAEIRAETLAQFGSDGDGVTGIRDGRANQLEQLLVDRARFRDGEHKLIVGMCTPITKGKF